MSDQTNVRPLCTHYGLWCVKSEGWLASASSDFIFWTTSYSVALAQLKRCDWPKGELEIRAFPSPFEQQQAKEQQLIKKCNSWLQEENDKGQDDTC